MPLSPEQSPTLHNAIQNFLARQARSATPILYQTARQALTLFETFLATHHEIDVRHVLLADLRVGWFFDYLHYLQDTRAVETEHLYSRALLAFYTHAAGEALLPIDTDRLAAKLAHRRRPKQHVQPHPPIQLIDDLLTALQTTQPQPHTQPHDRDYLRALRDHAFLLTLANTGLKPSEICALRRSHLDPHTHELSTATHLRLPLPPTTYRAITAYLHARQPLDAQQCSLLADLPLFARHDKRAGQRILPISRWTAANIVDDAVHEILSASAREQLSASGQTISPQTFRHYFVAQTLQRTGSLTETQTLARHAHPSTTRRYLPAQPQAAPSDSQPADGSHAE